MYSLRRNKDAKKASGEAFGFADTVSPLYVQTKGCCLGGTLRPQAIHTIEKQVFVLFALTFAAFAFNLFNP